MTTALPQALFRFVAVRRPAPPVRPLPPPDDDVVDNAFDFSDALLPVVAQVIRRDDRDAATRLVNTLLNQLPKPLAQMASKLRKLRHRAAINDELTLAEVRPLEKGAALADVVQRAATVIVLERWLGAPNSPNTARAAAILRGAVIARLALSSLDGGYRISDLVRGHTIQLPDIVQQPDPKPQNGFEPKRLQQDLRRLTSRATAVGLGNDPSLITMRSPALGELEPIAERAVEAAQRIGLPPTMSSSSLNTILDLEVDAGIELPEGVPLPPPSLPALEARARVLGRGDLMVVRTSHLRYELGEIAYIENVLKSELRGRTMVVDTSTSQKIVETVDLFSETSQELTTTERFELQEAANTANTSTTSVSAGMNVSGGFGPVTVGIDLNASHSTSTSESNSASSSYAKEVTDRATETMRSEASTRTITTNRTRVTETNKHDFDNRAGEDHIRGIYRWLNKVDQAQVYNYGERLLLEFVLPEPAAQHVYLATTTAAEGEPVPPEPLDFGPKDITVNNFVTLGRRYDTVGLQRPPALSTTVPATFSFPPAMPSEEVNPGEDAPPVMMANAVTTSAVSIPDGYAAGTVIVSVVYGGELAVGEKPPADSGVPEYVLQQAPVNISAGGQRFSIWAGHPEESHVIELQQRRVGDLPIAIGSQQVKGQAIAVRVIAYRTEEAFDAWQHSTFELIQQAFLAKQSAYETAASVAQLRQGYTAVTASDVNRSVEVRELTRGCQTILTGQDFDLFGSVSTPADDIPRIDIDEAWIEADAIVFFSDVIDWSLMIYLFYPYQWAGRHRWPELAARTSPDPLHQAFLQAGAARVVVPVREGFEHVVARYMRTADIPEWGPEPWRGRLTNYPKIDELIADALDRPEGEVAVDEPWEVVAPTTLIYLQQDAELNPA